MTPKRPRHYRSDPRRWKPQTLKLLQHQKRYRHWLHRLRRTQRVSVCYDGKSGRAVEGRVLRARRGVVWVRFPRFGGNSGVAIARFVDGQGKDQGGDMMRTLGIGDADLYVLYDPAECPPRQAPLEAALEATARPR